MFVSIFKATFTFPHAIVFSDNEYRSSQLGRQWVSLSVFLHTKLVCSRTLIKDDTLKIIYLQRLNQGLKTSQNIKSPYFDISVCFTNPLLETMEYSCIMQIESF